MDDRPSIPAAALADPVPTMEPSYVNPSRIKRIRVKIFKPHNHHFERKVFSAGARAVFSEEGVDGILGHVAEAVEKLYPEHEYSIVQVDEDAFNFVWRAEKVKTAAEAAA